VCRRLQQHNFFRSTAAEVLRSNITVSLAKEPWEDRSLLQKEPWKNRSPLQTRPWSSSAIAGFLWQKNPGKIYLFCKKSPGNIGKKARFLRSIAKAMEHAMSAAYEHGFAEGLVDETERRGVF